MATIVARPHPLRSDCYSAEVADGATLYGLMGDLPECVLSQVDGEVWGRDRWNEPLPAGALVTLYSTPEGDAGRAIAMIAVAVLAAYTGGAAAAAMGFAKGTTAFAVASAATSASVTLAGSLAVNALIPPKQPSMQSAGQSPNVRQSITGTRNQMDLYGVVPRVYGNPRWYPKLAATPVTEIAGNDQYLRMLLCLGYGPLEIDGTRVGGSHPLMKTRAVGDAIRIGETSIDEFDDVEWEIGTQDKLSLKFPDIHEEAVGVALNAPWHDDDSWYPDGASAIRTTAKNTREISVDIAFPGIFSTDKKGKRQWASVRFSISYRPTGGGAWTTVESQWQVDGKSADTKRVNKRWAVPVGQYDVEVTRTESLYWGSSGAHYDAIWTVMRSIQEGPAYTGDHVMMALRIRATDQLNGVIDQLNVKSQAVLRTYNGTSFVEQATSNPAWAYLDSMSGQQVGKPVPDAQIDWAGIRDWAAFCVSQGLEYHFVHDGAETVLERARAIASTGQASFSLQDGLFGVVRDDATAPVVQAITPRNATGFSSSRTFKDLPHALRVKYIDPDTWSDAERYVYRDGYDETNATRFEDFETQGVASADEAFHHGMYHFRQAILRPETHRVSMDWENLAVMRGNRVRLAYDTIKVGLGWGRVKSVDGATIVLDDEVQYTTQKAYGIRVRGAEGPQGTTAVTAPVIGQTNTLVMSGTIDVQPGDLVLYGEMGKESIDCKAISIEHGPDFTADLTLVPAATDIYNYGEPPVWDAGITNPIPIDRIRPPTPRITDVRGDESAAHIGQDGTPITLLRVAYVFAAQHGLPSLEVEARYRIVEGSDADPWAKVGPFSASGNLTIRDVDDGSSYEVQVRAINGAMYSPWSQTAALTVSGKGVSVPISVDVRRGTFTLTLIPQGLYPNQQWEFYRSAAPLALGDVEANAVNLGVAVALTDVDLMPDTTYYYYVRGWSISYTSAWYAVEAKTENSPNAVMGVISGEIKKGDLWPLLQQDIDDAVAAGTSITDLRDDVDGIWGFRIDNDGLVSGMVQGNDGQTASTIFRNDEFIIAPPGLPGDEVIPFIVKGNTTYLKEAMIDQLTFDKLTDAGGTFIVENGKLKAEYIQADQLVVNQGQSTNYSPGSAGWKLTKTGGEINFPISFSSVQGAPGPGVNYVAKNEFSDGDVGTWGPGASVAWGGGGTIPFLKVTRRATVEEGNSFGVIVGQKYRVRFYAYTASANGDVGLGLKVTRNDSSVGWYANPVASGVGESIITIPAGARTAKPYVLINAQDPNTGWAWVNDIEITRLSAEDELTRSWVKPNTTLIDGGKLYTHDAFIVNAMIKNAAVDTLEIKGEAVAVTRFINSGSTGNLVAWKKSGGAYSSWYSHGSVGISTGSSGGQTVVTVDAKVECNRTNSNKAVEIQLQVYVVETGEIITFLHARVSGDTSTNAPVDIQSWSTNIVVPANSGRTVAVRYRWYSSSTTNLSAYVRYVRISATLMKNTGV